MDEYSMTSAVVSVNDDKCVVTVLEGRAVLARPSEDAEGLARARALGFTGTDEEALWAMARDHDRLHTLVAEAWGMPHSIALWHTAFPEAVSNSLDKALADMEERTVLLIQRLLNEGVDKLMEERK